MVVYQMQEATGYINCAMKLIIELYIEGQSCHRHTIQNSYSTKVCFQKKSYFIL